MIQILSTLHYVERLIINQFQVGESVNMGKINGYPRDYAMKSCDLRNSFYICRAQVSRIKLE